MAPGEGTGSAGDGDTAILPDGLKCLFVMWAYRRRAGSTLLIGAILLLDRGIVPKQLRDFTTLLIKLLTKESDNMNCDDCKYFEPFNGVCCNPDSPHCADMPWQFGIDGCEHGEKIDN